VDTAGRIWEGDSVQLATKEVGLKLIPWMRGAGRIPRQRSDWRVNLTAGVVSVTEIFQQLQQSDKTRNMTQMRIK
jgi:hypothetical protein